MSRVVSYEELIIIIIIKIIIKNKIKKMLLYIYIYIYIYDGKSLNNRNFILKCMEKYAQ